MKHTSIRAMILVIASLVSLSQANADDIRLHASVRLPDGVDRIRLCDVAAIEGKDAARFADLVLLDINDPTMTQRITIEQVRSALDDAGVHWGRVNLSGRTVLARPGRQFVAAGSPKPMTEVSLVAEVHGKGKSKPQNRDIVREAAAVIHEPTLRGAIARFICEGLVHTPENVELSFNPDDGERLDRSAEMYRFELRSEGSLLSDRVTLTVRFWQGERVVESDRITIELRLRTQVAILQRDIHRDQVIARTDFSQATHWLPPSESAQVASPEAAANHRLVTRNLKRGDLLRAVHMRKPTLIERGEQVTVRCLVGGVAITLQAEARADASEGEIIECRKLGERDTFTARVTGVREAVLIIH